MNFSRLLNSNAGKNLISVILGLGLASLFHKVCKDKNCIIFKGPIISEVDGKIFQHGNECFKYDIENVKCDLSKKILHISNDNTKLPVPKSLFDNIQSVTSNVGSIWSPSTPSP
jgi:hypothetical protein